uniref:RNA-binding protein 41 n=1 Tax=Myripristis murdjan TaxID=586833 RepID=A0A667ZDT4_9TELE
KLLKCVAKRQCFAPAALYRPFGEQAAGVRSLSQFQALQDGEKELASLRELGLTDAEIQLWQSQDDPNATDKSRGVCVAPGAKQQRLQAIRDKIEARAELLSRPQRFSASRPLSRREIEIERALFQGSDRLGFLTALYHRDEDNQDSQQGASSSDPMDSLYRDVLSEDRQQASPQDSQGETDAPPNVSTPGAASHQSQSSQKDTSQSQPSQKHADQSEGSAYCHADPTDQPHTQDRQQQTQLAAPKQINVNQPIGSLRAVKEAGQGGPLTIRGAIENIPDEEILKNRESMEGIRSIPRFCNYQPGEPSKVLCVKNLSAQASAAQLVALFSRFEVEGGPPIVYRLLTGRLKGQAFITLQDTETAQKALQLVHGYRLLGKPVVVEFGRERREEQKHKEEEPPSTENHTA